MCRRIPLWRERRRANGSTYWCPSIEYAGNIIPVELAVFDTDGQKGLSVPSSMEQEAFNEAMANIGSGLGTSISFAQSAGQQVAMDVTRACCKERPAILPRSSEP